MPPLTDARYDTPIYPKEAFNNQDLFRRRDLARFVALVERGELTLVLRGHAVAELGHERGERVEVLDEPQPVLLAIFGLVVEAGMVVEAVIGGPEDVHVQSIPRSRAAEIVSAKVSARGPNTVAMVYYAGHGVQLAGENYLVPIDAKVSNQTELVNDSVRLVDVMSTLETIPSRMRIVILDAVKYACPSSMSISASPHMAAIPPALTNPTADKFPKANLAPTITAPSVTTSANALPMEAIGK